MQSAKIIQKPITSTSNKHVLLYVTLLNVIFDIYLFVFTCWGEGAAGGVGRVGGKELFLILLKL